MTNPTEIQEVILALQRKGWTTSAISRGINVRYSTVRRWIIGARCPESPTAVAMALKQLLRKPVPKRPYRKAS